MTVRLAGFGSVSVTRTDRHSEAIVRVAIVGLVLSAAVAVLGLPPVGLHLPTHDLGIMMPTCGATRAVARAAAGDLLGAWRFNPLGPVLVIGAWGCVAREVVGRGTGWWTNVQVALSPAGRWTLGAAVLALVVRQQLHAATLA